MRSFSAFGMYGLLEMYPIVYRLLQLIEMSQVEICQLWFCNSFEEDSCAKLDIMCPSSSRESVEYEAQAN